MKKRICRALMPVLLALALSGCSVSPQTPQVAATTLPVYTFTLRLCEGSEVGVTRLITENVSCLHDYTLQVRQMRALESAQAVVLSGAGLEDFLEEPLQHVPAVIDASEGIRLLPQAHEPEADPHIWLSPENAKAMAGNICAGLTALFPEDASRFQENLLLLNADLDALASYGRESLSALSCRELIPFHDGFSYFA